MVSLEGVVVKSQIADLLAGLRCIEDIAKSKNALLKFDI
jgi:hypothetical protein